MIILNPVGTSVIWDSRIEDAISYPLGKSALQQLTDQLVDHFIRKGPVSAAFANGQRADPDHNPAEMSSLYAFWKNKHPISGSVEVVLIHSPNLGEVCALAIEKLIKSKNYFSGGQGWSVSRSRLDHLDPQKADTFPLALDELAQIVKGVLERAGDQEIYINVTGGYKALTPYLTMMGLALGERVQTFYLYEASPEIIFLPSYPLAFDLLEWRDYRSLLLPFTNSLDLTDEQRCELRAALCRTKVQSLIQPGPPYQLNPVGRIMAELYQGGQGVRISEFGAGAILLDRLAEKKFDWAAYLADHCLPRWRHLSVGDRIPETVDHGRGHVQRILELAQELLIAAKIDLTDEELFVLLGGIWLHDLGHSGDFFQYEGAGGLIRNPADPQSIGPFICYGRPQMVRDYHNVLTYHLLKTYGDFLFPNSASLGARKDVLLNSVLLACLYHRRAMPTRGAAPYKGHVQVARGLADFTGADQVIERLALVGALLRFLDATENQEERSGLEEHVQVVKWVWKRHKDFVAAHQGYIKDHCLGSVAEFKDSVFEHFEKHQRVRNVFFVAKGAGPLDQAGIYGKNGSQVVVAYFLANHNHFDANKIVTQIINPVLGEFRLVQDILPFRLALKLVSGENFNNIQQVIVTPDSSQKDETWLYKLI